MKRILSSFILSLPLFFSAQMATKEKHLEIANAIKKDYNEKNYKGIYELLDKSYQEQIKEKELADFFKFNIFDYYGDMLEIKYSAIKPPFHEFLVECKNGRLDLSLNCTPEGKVAGMQWLPHREVFKEYAPTKNENYLTDNPKSSDWDKKVDSIVKNYMTNGANCGLSIAIYHDKKLSYYNYGETKRGSKVLPGKNTIYEIGSVSKVFAGILLAQAVKDKKVSLNDDIRKYLPSDYKNLSYKGKPIELIHLANHTSRIPRLPADIDKQPGYDPLNPYKHYKNDLIYAYLRGVVIDTFPGTKSEYSNLGMSVLGMILEKVYEKSFDELTQEYISKPLGLSSTKMLLSDEEKKRFVQGYAMEGNETPHWDLGDMAAAGGLRSTPEDMIHFVKANLEEANEALKLSHSPTFNDGRNQTGLAWQVIITKKGNEMIWHNGGTFGFSAFASFIKSKGLGVAILSNSGNPVDPIALGILKLLQ
jgi:CubicO group peptidase (beta-lactamase class C family)